MKSKKLTVCLLLFVLGILQVACSFMQAPVRLKPTPSSTTLTIVEMPEILLKGEAGTFSVKTDPMNTCLGSIEYRDESGKWIGVDLPELEAGETGICTWTWTVPLQSSAGDAGFRVAAKQQGEFDMLVPQTFCIEECLYREERIDPLKALGINWPFLLLRATYCLIFLLPVLLLFIVVLRKGNVLHRMEAITRARATGRESLIPARHRTMPKLSKPVKALIGIGTAWVTLYFALFFTVVTIMFLSLFLFPGSEKNLPTSAPYLFALFPLHSLTALVQIGLIGFYLIHLIKNTAASETARIVLGVGIFLFSPIVMPIYYYLYIWRDQPPTWALAQDAE